MVTNLKVEGQTRAHTLLRHKWGYAVKRASDTAGCGQVTAMTPHPLWLCGDSISQLPQFSVDHTNLPSTSEKYSISSASSFCKSFSLDCLVRDLAIGSLRRRMSSFSSLSMRRCPCLSMCNRAPLPFVMSALVMTSTGIRGWGVQRTWDPVLIMRSMMTANSKAVLLSCLEEGHCLYSAS